MILTKTKLKLLENENSSLKTKVAIFRKYMEKSDLENKLLSEENKRLSDIIAKQTIDYNEFKVLLKYFKDRDEQPNPQGKK